MKTRWFFLGSRGHKQFFKWPRNTEVKPQDTEDCEAWWSKHYDMGMFDILRCHVYLSQTRDHEYIRILEHYRIHVLLAYAEEEMSLKLIFQQNKDPKHSTKQQLLVPDQTD